MPDTAGPSRLKRALRRLARPLLGPLDGRVADISRRVGTVGAAVDSYAAVLDTYTRATLESVSYAGVELRRIEQAVEQLLAASGAADAPAARTVELPFAFRALGRVEAGEPILTGGRWGVAFATSAAALGYDVTLIDRTADAGGAPGELKRVARAGLAASAEPRFAAAFLVGVGGDPLAELADIAGALAGGGFVALTAAGGVALELPAGWEELERRSAPPDVALVVAAPAPPR